jgi:hypothetical protein
MRVVALYRSNSEHERSVIDLDREYNHRTGRSLKLLDLNSRDGAATASLYDIVQYPAILALGDDGKLLQLWQGLPFPLLNDIMYYDQPQSFALSAHSW